MGDANLLPSSLLRDPGVGEKQFRVDGALVNMAPLYCWNCGHGPGPYVTVGCNAAWLCPTCEEKDDGALAKLGYTLRLPDQVHNDLLLAEQIETRGRPWTELELVTALDNPHSTISALARDFGRIFRKGI